MECPWDTLHCPYCGSHDITRGGDKEMMTCRACGESKEIPPLELIQLEDRLARAISAPSIQDRKAKARQLTTIVHRRWRSTMCYLDPASSAAISHAHGLMLRCRTSRSTTRRQGSQTRIVAGGCSDDQHGDPLPCSIKSERTNITTLFWPKVPDAAKPRPPCRTPLCLEESSRKGHLNDVVLGSSSGLGGRVGRGAHHRRCSCVA